jgi:trimeric autotransporter adhesin
MPNNEDISKSIRILSEAPAAVAAAPIASAGGKIASRLVPGLGAAAGAYDAYQRGKAGDTTGAAIAGLTGAASTIPVVGTAAALAGTGIQAVRDKWRTGSWLPSQDEIAAAAQKDGTAKPVAGAPATAVGQIAQTAKNAGQAVAQATKADPTKVNKFKDLLSKIQQSQTVQVSGKINKGDIMSESNQIASLRDRLAQIEEGRRIDELGGVVQGAKNLYNVGKGFVQGAVGGAAKAGDAATAAAQKGADAAKAIKSAGMAKINTQAAAAKNAGTTAAANITKGGTAGAAVNTAAKKIAPAAGIAAVAGGAGYLGAKAGSPDAAGQQAAAEPAAGGSAQPAAGGAAKSDPAVVKLQQDLVAKGAKIKVDGIMGPQTQAAMKQFGGAPAAGASAQPAAAAADTTELDALAKEMEPFKNDPAVAALLKQYATVKGGAAAPAAGAKESIDPLLSIKHLAGL